MFMAMMEDTYKNKKLHRSGRRGVLNLIPKGNKDPRLLKNLRPITLLNTDYKILEKCIAHRMVPELQEIIHKDQTGFLPERRIAVNIRKILDLTVSTIENGTEGIIMSCDYLKCFDRIELCAVIGAMKAFKFSQRLINWVSTLYCDFRIKVQNNGEFSEEIKVSRSVRQGGPASNAIFLVVAELVAILLRQDKRIQGINMGEISQLLNQYADDMDVSMCAEQETLDRVLGNIRVFQQNSGFQLSYEKTTLYRIGSLRRSEAKLYTKENISWSNRTINILGVEVTNDNDSEKLIELNYSPIVAKAKNIVSNWGHRRLSLIGKVNVINTLIASLFVYKMQVLPKISEKIVKELYKIIEDYLWNYHRPKISLKTLQQSKDNGRLQLVNFEKKDDSLKCTWVKTLIREDYPTSYVYQIIGNSLGHVVWSCNLSPEDVNKVIKCSNQFWIDVVKAWCRYHFTEGETEGDQIIWWNSHIRIKNSPFQWPDAIMKGLTFVSQLFDDRGFQDEQQLIEKYGLAVMQLNSLKSAIPAWMKKHTVNSIYRDKKFSEYSASERSTHTVYVALLKKDALSMKEKQDKWNNETLGEEGNVNLVERLKYINQVTTVVKYRSFLYRLLHRAIVTNIDLARWKIIQENVCSFCEMEAEKYETPLLELYGSPKNLGNSGVLMSKSPWETD